MNIHNSARVSGNDIRRRSAGWDLTDLDHGETGVRARSQVAERPRDSTGAIDFELEPHRAGPLSAQRTTQRAAPARTGQK